MVWHIFFKNRPFIFTNKTLPIQRAKNNDYILLKMLYSFIGFFHYWRNGIFDIFWTPLAPLPIVTLFITEALALLSQIPWPPPPLIPWRHLWTTTYKIDIKIILLVQKLPIKCWWDSPSPIIQSVPGIVAFISTVSCSNL
jgi:hypothetical protein